MQPASVSGQTTFGVTMPLAAHIPQPASGPVSGTVNRPVSPTLQASAGSLQPKQSSASGAQTLPMEEVTRKLAIYIGPVAKFVVKKLAAQSDDMDFIYREAAKQISSDTDRAAFLKSKRQ